MDADKLWRLGVNHLVALAVAAACAPAWAADDPAEAGAEFDAAAVEFFEKRVRPILVDHCSECHGAESGDPKGGLRIDSRQALLAGGDTGSAIVPGDPDASLLMDAVNYGDVYQMPPETKLPDAEIETLAEWIEMGAPWPAEEQAAASAPEEFDLAARKAEHWCWEPIRTPPLPKVSDADWPQQELDHFVLARLEAQGLAPAPRARKRTLIRRAYFDLVGLPPSPAAVDAFLDDDSPGAFQRLVDRLLASPRFGERWARHWMDLVRYAETYGHEFDYPIPHAYRYRDYLIRVLNSDVPFDQFVREHIAGDLLPEPRRHPTEGFNESIIGTAFWWLGEATHGPVDVLGDEADRIENQIDVMSKTFLALTVACARCHDHKFDAITTEDYYALAGFLQSSRRHKALLDPQGKIAEGAERLQQIRRSGDRALLSAVPSSNLSAEPFADYLLAARQVMHGESQQGAESQLAVDASSAQHQLDPQRLARFVDALSDEAVKRPSHPLYPWSVLAADPTAEAFEDLRQRVEQQAEEQAERAQKYPLLSDFEELDDWFIDGTAFLPAPTTAGMWDAERGAGRLVRPGMAHSGLHGKQLQGVLRSPTFTLNHKNIYYRAAGRGVKIRLVIDGYFMDEYSSLLFRGFTFELDTDGKLDWHRQAQDIGRYTGHRGYLEIIDHGEGSVALDEIRFSNEDSPPPERLTPLAAELFSEGELDSLADLARQYADVWRRFRASGPARASSAGTAPPTGRAATDLWNWCVQHELVSVSEVDKQQLGALRKEFQATAAALPAPEKVLAMTDGTPEDQPIYIRGNHRTPGELAPRRFLDALTDEPEPISDGSGRLKLAREIASPDNPLTARVQANRIWHHLLGRGIVATVDNFGVLGERPTHPKLLDFLAGQFVRDGWSVKRLIRRILLSSTYQMDSAPRPNAEAVDPENLLVHRMRIRRLQGEPLRDAILGISGRLDRTMYGPSVPVHITPFMQGRGRPKESGPLDGDGRRSIYTEVRRNFLPPMMLAYDMPTPFNTVGRRATSNVPAQALILMNDPFVVEQAEAWAKRLLQQDSSSADRIAAMYQSAFARPPRAREVARAKEFLKQQSKEYDLAPAEGQQDVRVWADLCHVLINTKEFVIGH